MLKAAEGNGSSFRFGIAIKDISINDHKHSLRLCQAKPLSLRSQMEYTAIYMYRTAINLLLLTALFLGSAFAADIDGKWTATYDTQNGPITTTWELKAEGNKLTGKANSSFGARDVAEGKIDGKEVSWVENIDAGGTAIKVVCKGTLNGDELKLSRTVGEFGTTETVAKRVK